MLDGALAWIREFVRWPASPQRLLERAVEACAQEQWDLARNTLHRLLRDLERQVEPDAEALKLRGDAHAALGDVETAAGLPQEAIAAYRRSIECGSADPRIVRIVAESAASAADRSAVALDAYVLYLQRFGPVARMPSDDKVLARIGQMCRLSLTLDDAGDDAETRRMLAFAQRLATADADYAGAQRAIGVCRCLAGQNKEGVASLRAAERLDPRDPVLPRLVAIAHLRSNPRSPEAEAPLRRSLVLDRHQADVLRLLALVLAPEDADRRSTAQGLAEARDLLRQAHEREPHSGETEYHLGRVEHLCGDLQAARSALAKAAAKLPAHLESRWLLAQVCAELSQPLEAAKVLEQLLRLSPADARACRRLGELLAGQGLHAKAELQFRRVLELRPDDAAARIALGHLRYAQRNWRGVVEALDPAASALPFEAALERARALDLCGRTRDALAAYEGCRARFGPSIELLVRIGCVRGRLNELDAALAAFDEAEALLGAAGTLVGATVPRRADLALYRGQALLRLGRHAEASAAFEAGAALDPQSVEVHYGAGVCAVRLDSMARAQAAFDRALAIDARHAGAWYGSGIVAEAFDAATAVQYYRKSLALDADQGACGVRLGIALTKAHDWSAALKAFEAADPGLAAQPEALAYRGFALAMSGALPQALTLWQKLGDASAPWLAYNLARAKFMLGRQAHQDGRYADAIAHFEAAGTHREISAFARQGLVEAGLALALDELADGTADGSALAALQRCRQIAPDDLRPRYYIGAMALARGDAKQAELLLEPIVSAEAPEPWQMRYYLALARLGSPRDKKVKAARQELRELARLHPAIVPIHIALAEAEARCGDWAAAFHKYRDALAADVPAA